MISQKNILITGTDTDVGKTIFAAGLTAALNATYWKPIQAGFDAGTDSEVVARFSGQPIVPEAYKLATPASPHYAAEQDNVELELGNLTIPEISGGGHLIIEAAGGLMVPLKRPDSNGQGGILAIDMFATWGVPTILCARTSLGTINHSLLSVKALKDAGIAIMGIVFIGDENIDSQQTIIEFANVPDLGRLPILNPLTRESLLAAIQAEIRLELMKL
ncbi:MAG: ATP-dependent dethiobiotin synthetase BioD [Rhizobiales bacterium]|nr:dethiobiotin synthase [Hyphomicrobiales bacterium]NRB13728.1 ATP-dependent dethiobiotin synthetase BioD [Hyphomicrobiales bacterium]